MHMLKLIASIIAIPLGAFFVYYGGYDDSPGLQGLGLIILCAGIYGIYRNWK